MSELELHKQEVEQLCRQHSVEKLYAFGSVLGGDFKPSSDIDLLVKFNVTDLKNYFINFFSFKTQLEKTFHRKVDLLEEQALKNPVLIRSIEKQKKLIYG